MEFHWPTAGIVIGGFLILVVLVTTFIWIVRMYGPKQMWWKTTPKLVNPDDSYLIQTNANLLKMNPNHALSKLYHTQQKSSGLIPKKIPTKIRRFADTRAQNTLKLGYTALPKTNDPSLSPDRSAVPLDREDIDRLHHTNSNSLLNALYTRGKTFAGLPSNYSISPNYLYSGIQHSVDNHNRGSFLAKSANMAFDENHNKLPKRRKRRVHIDTEKNVYYS